MAVTLNTLSAIDTSSGSPQATHSGTFTLASGIEWLTLCIGTVRNSGTTALTLDALTITDGSGNVLTLTGNVIQRSDAPSSLAWCIAIATGSPANASPSALVAGSCTVSMTFSANVVTGGADLWVFQLDSGASASNPYRGMAGTGIFSSATSDPFTAFDDLALEDGGFAIAFAMRSNGTMTVAGSSTGGSWTQADDTSFSGARASVQYKAVSANYTETALALNPSIAVSHLGFFFWLKEVNDCDINSAATAPFEPGETVAFTGTAMDASGAGARMRKVGGTSSYDALGTPSSVTSTTFSAAIPNRPSRTPYTSEDGTTHTVEFVGTTSGAVTGTATSAYTFSPPTGYARTTLTTPDLTSASLCYDCGWTCIAGDQIEYESTVNVSGTDVTITVNTDGTVTLDSTPDPLPDGVSFAWRAYDSAAELWTGDASDQSDWATWSDGGEAPPSGGTGTGGPIYSPIRSPIRSAVRSHVR